MQTGRLAGNRTEAVNKRDRVKRAVRHAGRNEEAERQRGI
jgi:hypothetical protein